MLATSARSAAFAKMKRTSQSCPSAGSMLEGIRQVAEVDTCTEREPQRFLAAMAKPLGGSLDSQAEGH